jgi:hypothetical protein
MSLNLTKLAYQACRDIGSLRAGTQSVQAPDLLNDIQDAANQMLDAWRIEYLMAFSYPAFIFPLQQALEQYKIGPGQAPPNFDAQRPDIITEANVIINFAGSNPTVRKQLILWGKSEWASISVRATSPGSMAPISAIPNGLYYDNGYDEATGFATINIWPAPGGPQPMSLEFWSSETMPFLSFADLTTVYNFPPAYERCIRKNLAVEILPLMWDRRKSLRIEGMQEPNLALVELVKAQAIEAKSFIMMNNRPDPPPFCDPAFRGSGNKPSWNYGVGTNGGLV